MKPLVIQLSPASHHFSAFRSKYSPQHPKKERKWRVTGEDCIMRSFYHSFTNTLILYSFVSATSSIRNPRTRHASGFIKDEFLDQLGDFLLKTDSGHPVSASILKPLQSRTSVYTACGPT